METIEEYKVVRILNDEPEFCEGQKANVLVNFFILCEEGKFVLGQNVHELEICGMNLVNWVSRACESRPKVLMMRNDSDIISVIRPYVDNQADYSVVLFADTPLVSKSHLDDLIEFVDRRRMNVCKLKRGFVFKNEYIQYNDEFYSIDEYDFASDDFLVVEDSESFAQAKSRLSKRIVDFHKRNGVQFEDENLVSIDANVKIGVGTKIASGVSVLKGAQIAENCIIERNVKVSGSTVGAGTRLGENAMVVDSIVKDSVFVGLDVLIKDSVIGNNAIVEMCVKIISSSLRESVILKPFVIVDEGRIGEGAIVHKHTRILGLTDRSVIGASSEIGANAEIVDSVIVSNSFIENNSKIINKVD